MTSSLVGSEMCIRDRMHAWMDGWMDAWMDGWMDGCMDGWMDGWDGWNAVSYTHLTLPTICSV
eukprot:3451098-Prorocentrum_lima.AAC.1